MKLNIQDIYEAASVIAGRIVNTPCTVSKTLSEITGAQVILKFENHQFTASFKERGALFKLLTLTEDQKKAGIIAMSAGNHAQAVAYHARDLNICATIVMPVNTPDVKVERTRAFGAKVLLHGEGLKEAREFTENLAKEKGFLLIHPYDDEKIIAGQGTIALEMLEAFPDLEMIAVPVGGGGLIAGNALTAKAIRPEIKIIGVEATRFPSMHSAIKGKRINCKASTIAEGIAVTEPGTLALPIVRDMVDDILLVDEHEIEKAVLLLLEVEKTVVEGAGAVGLAALLGNRDRFKGKKVGIILSGGNIDLLKMSSIIQRGLVRSGRMVRLRVGVQDVPGSLGEITALLGKCRANIVEIHHQRAFTNLSLRSAEVEFVLQTLGNAHINQILDALGQAGYESYIPGTETKKMRD